MKIEAVKSKSQAKARAVSILILKMANAESKDVPRISKELRKWIKRFPNRESYPNRFIKSQKRELIKLIGRKNSRLLLKAVKNNIPIMIYESGVEKCIDGSLYGVLKRLGAKSVKNLNISLGNEGMVNGIYITYFNVKKDISSSVLKKS